MIFQDALSALNPVFTVGFQIARAAPRSGAGMSRSGRPASAPIELLDLVQDPGAKAAGRATTRTSSPAACGSA